MSDSEIYESKASYRRPPSSLLKESSADDRSLYTERRSSIVPFTTSPFFEKPPSPVDEEPAINYEEHEVPVYATEIPWSDLLLELAMTTTFASLTDGTPILTGSAVASYLSFFILVWWVWASQVAYNVRFRQSDWLHRLFVFLQLLIFGSLAAFTNSFDDGIQTERDVQIQNEVAAFDLVGSTSQQELAAANFRDNWLPELNARGISITMAFSRLVLLAQYLLTLYHLPPINPKNQKPIKRNSLYVHIGSLIFSVVCYFIAFGLVNVNPSQSEQITKIVLWYLPLFSEVAAHFIAQQVPGQARYKPEAIYQRSSTVFTIILGGGLDKITNGFQYVVGNVAIGFQSAFQIICTAIIFTLLFTLYFGSSKGDKIESKRALAFFFFQFFYLSALIVLLQGIAAMLSVGNMANALSIPFGFITESKALMESKGPGVPLHESDYSESFVQAMKRTGIVLSEIVNNVNVAITEDSGPNFTDYTIPFGVLLQEDLVIITTILKNFNAMPDDGSLLLAQINAFFSNPANNTTIVNEQMFFQIAERIITSNARPALWFYAAGGAVLFVLALMSLISRWPRDRYEWGRTISRLVLGALIIVFTAMDVYASDNVLTEDFKYKGSRIWYLATHAWVLPPYALALLVEQLVELGLLHIAGRSYRLDDLTVSFHRVPSGSEHWQDTEHHLPKVSYFDPYRHYDEPGVVESLPISAGLTNNVDALTKRIMYRYKHTPADSASQPLVNHG